MKILPHESGETSQQACPQAGVLVVQRGRCATTECSANASPSDIQVGSSKDDIESDVNNEISPTEETGKTLLCNEVTNNVFPLQE